MEIKWKRNVGAEELEALAEQALKQIDSRRYDSEMQSTGIREILKFGIAFLGKKVRVTMKNCRQQPMAISE